VTSIDEDNNMEQPEGMHTLMKGSVNNMAISLHFS